MSDNTDATTEAAEHLRRTLAAAAAATPTTDRTAELRTALGSSPRISGAALIAVPSPDEDPLYGDDPSSAPPSASARRRRWPAVAAAAAVLAVGAAGAVVATRLPAPEQVVDAASSDPTSDPEPVPSVGTGWYLPPEGWEVLSVDTDFLNVGEVGACPCTSWGAGRASDAAALDVFESAPIANGVPPIDAEVATDVGGRPGRSNVAEITTLIVSGDRQLIVQADGVELDDLVAVADAWLDQRDAGRDIDPDALPLPEGFSGTAVLDKTGTSEHMLAVRTREAATGREVEYQLVPSGYNRNLLLYGEGLEPVGDGFRVVAGEGVEGFVADIGGPADIVVGPSFFDRRVDELTAAERLDLAEGMREVTTAEWRRALEAAEGEVDPDVLEAPTLYDPPLVQD